MNEAEYLMENYGDRRGCYLLAVNTVHLRTNTLLENLI